MIRKCHNHKLQTTPWHREEEPPNHHETPGRHIKQSNQLKSQLKLKVLPMKEAWLTKITSKSESLFLEVKQVGSFTILLKSKISQTPFIFSLLGPLSILKLKSPSKIKCSYFPLILSNPKVQSCSKVHQTWMEAYMPQAKAIWSHLIWPQYSYLQYAWNLGHSSCPLQCQISRKLPRHLHFEYGLLIISDSCQPWIARNKRIVQFGFYYE